MEYRRYFLLSSFIHFAHIGGVTMKSIKSKILIAMLAIGLLTSVVLGACGTMLNFNSSNDVLDKTLSETAEQAAARIELEINRYEAIAAEIGCIGDLSNASLSDAEKSAIVAERIERYNLEACGILNMQGKDISTGLDCSDDDFFKSASAGEVYCSDFIFNSKFDSKNAVVIAAPVWKGGISGSEIVGVVYIIPSHTCRRGRLCISAFLRRHYYCICRRNCCGRKRSGNG